AGLGSRRHHQRARPRHALPSLQSQRRARHPGSRARSADPGSSWPTAGAEPPRGAGPLAGCVCPPGGERVIAPAAPPLAADLVESLRRLKLATMREQAPEVLQTAMTQRWSAEEVLRSLLQAEIAARDAANRRIRLKQGGFPVLKTLEAFKVADSSIPRPTFEYIASLEWVRARENVLLIGPPGTGKSHALVGCGVRAVERGMKVRY